MMQNPHSDILTNKGPKGDKGDCGPAGTFTTPTADVSFGNHKITNLGTPRDSTDAVNKNYADSRYIRVGEQINMGSNRITHLNDPSDNYDALNRRYADTRYLRSGQNINLGSNSISSSSTPTADNDLVNKAYVESVRIKIKDMVSGFVIYTDLKLGSRLTPGGIWLFFLIKYTNNGIQKTKSEVMVGADKNKTISLPEITIIITPNGVTIQNIVHSRPTTINKMQIYYIWDDRLLREHNK